MLITRPISEPCPMCDTVGKHGNVSVARNWLTRGCNACDERYDLELPQIRKQVLYLDQSFLSHAFRGTNAAYVDAAKRVISLVRQQQLVCPWSLVHELETHQWKAASQQALWEFIKKTAVGHRFRIAAHVKRAQLGRAFTRFIAREPVSGSVERQDALPWDIDHWENYFWVDVRRKVDDPDVVRRNKDEATKGLVAAFDDWRQGQTTFDDDRMSEVRACASGLVQLYRDSFKHLLCGDLAAWMQAPADGDLIEGLMHKDDKAMSMKDRHQRIGSFLQSDHFANVPYIDISCRLFTVLRKHVKEGQFANRARAAVRIRGVWFDTDAVSLYGPYCDAMFVDREIRRWLNDSDGGIAEKYGLRLFSAETWSELSGFFGELEAKISPEHRQALHDVYGL